MHPAWPITGRLMRTLQAAAPGAKFLREPEGGRGTGPQPARTGPAHRDLSRFSRLATPGLTISQKKVLCNGSWIFLINKTMLLLVTKEESHYFVETGKDSLNMKYEGAFRDPESARNRFDPKEAKAAPFLPTKTQQVQQTTNEMPWWQILLIVVAILVVIAGVTVTVVFRNRLCRGNRQNEPSANQTELERLENSQVRNGPELPATA